MKTLILLATMLIFAGCVYESPLSEEHTIAIDPGVLGLWEEIPDEATDSSEMERMLVMRFSDTEYLVRYQSSTGADYYRAYPIKIGKVSCIQLQSLGSGKGPLPAGENQQYLVASYQLDARGLEVKLLNSDLVTDKISDPLLLRKAFLDHQDEENLFSGPGRFRRISDQK
jgi:hypothetical protein